MKTARLLFVAFVAASAHLSAALIQLNPSADTFIWTEIDQGVQANVAQGASGSGQINKLYMIRSGFYVAVPLLRFDLSAYAGLIVSGDATLRLDYSNIANGSYGASRTIDIVSLTEAFDPATTTYNNYNGPASFGDVLSTFSGAVGVTGQPNGTPGFLTFTVPQATLQSWIDSPGTNLGIALYGQETARDIYFYSADSAFAPVLSFTAVPEPSAFAVFAGALALAGALLLRRRQ